MVFLVYNKNYIPLELDKFTNLPDEAGVDLCKIASPPCSISYKKLICSQITAHD